MRMERAERWASMGDHTCLMKLAPVHPSGFAELLARLPPDDGRLPETRCPSPPRNRGPSKPERAPWWAESQAPSVNEFYVGHRDRLGEQSTDFWYLCVDRSRDAVYVLSGNT
jgi:hypothetical protein